jgi:hypothetical protein
MSESASQALKRRFGEERSDAVGEPSGWKSPHERRRRRPDEHERGCGDHQEKVLHHMGLEQQAREGVERRQDSDDDRRDAGTKGREASDTEVPGRLAAKPRPATRVENEHDCCGEDEPWIETP